MYLVRARKVGNSIVLTSPTAIAGQLYRVTISNNGAIIYMPVNVTRQSAGENRELEL
jgi:antitoxin component of MazEF toxin-antitoxin module